MKKVLLITLGICSLFATAVKADVIANEATTVATTAIKTIAAQDGQIKNPQAKSSSLQRSSKIIARSTSYHATEPGSDSGTIRGKTATSVPIKTALSKGMGIVAVDPNKIPYGSLVITPNRQVYVALDTGSDVISRKAARELARKKNIPQSNQLAQAPVLDFYSTKQVGGYWDYFLVIRYEGPSFKALTTPEKGQYLDTLSKHIFGTRAMSTRKA